MTIPLLLYGSVAWTTKKSHIQKIRSSEMTLLRAVAGYRILTEKGKIYEKNDQERNKQHINLWAQHVLL